MVQPFRNPAGGLIDRTRMLPFTFDGRRYEGHPGDTLGSALLANGVRLVGRSFKYHRPRGIMAAGVEEPNALVQLRRGARTEPNIRATQAELFTGLEAWSQNRWPSLRFDLGGLTGALAPLFPAGFYYKTFKWPPGSWMLYERGIRRAAGLGRAPAEADPDTYEKTYAFADVLIAGGGPTGLAAALAAGRAGARVILAEERPAFGGALLVEGGEIEGRPAAAWVQATLAELETMPEVTLLPRTTAVAYYDHNLVVLAERITDHLPEPPPRTPRQRLWRVRAQQVVLATGAIERPIPFADNDRPGVMLAFAARAYANQYAVRPGTRAVVFTNNDSAYDAARDLQVAGVEVAAVVDVRPDTRQVPPPGTRHLKGHAVVQALGRREVKGVLIAPLTDADRLAGPGERLECDLVCVAGGWSPNVHLHAQARGRPAYDAAITAFVPGTSFQRERSAGAAKGSFALAACLAEGFAAGRATAAAAGFDKDVGAAPSAPTHDEATPIRACWSVPPPAGAKAKRFVDHQNDVTAEDVALAAHEGYDHVELLKRYTTLGMGTDQGRTSNVPGLALLAGVQGRDIPAVGTTTFRPPFAPVSAGTLAGRENGPHHPPIRRTPLHHCHEEANAHFVNAGLWKRPAWYPRAGESMWDAIFREARAVRHGVGIVDVSTLGKLDLQGPDVGAFLDRVYVNRFDDLAVGRCRYGVMLREDGMVLDDGTTSRIAADHFVMTTTTARAAEVLRRQELLLQVLWPELDVHLVSVSEEWAQVALAGPRSRDVLARIADLDVSNDALPFMAVREGMLAGVPGRIFRISFSGELAYELAVPADFGPHLWQALLEAGHPFDLVPYGTEAMNILRIEKGHVTGNEINGRTTADDLGFGRMLRAEKSCIGKRSLRRPGLARNDRPQLVGLAPLEGATRVPRGGQLVADAGRTAPNPIQGQVTSTCWSPNLERPIALALLERGRARTGERLFASSPLRGETVEVEVVAPVFLDPAGERLRG